MTSSRQRSRGRRRVVALSVGDRDRVARGGCPEDLPRADYASDALRPAPWDQEKGDGSDRSDRDSVDGSDDAHDRRLLREVPPHW